LILLFLAYPFFSPRTSVDAALLIDLGSTFTKVCSVDLEAEELIASAVFPSTVETDIGYPLRD
jgi:hypothetical protein